MISREHKKEVSLERKLNKLKRDEAARIAFNEIKYPGRQTFGRKQPKYARWRENEMEALAKKVNAWNIPRNQMENAARHYSSNYELARVDEIEKRAELEALEDAGEWDPVLERQVQRANERKRDFRDRLQDVMQELTIHEIEQGARPGWFLDQRKYNYDEW